MATFMSTQRGGRKLIYEDHSYNKVRDSSDGKIYWRCDKLSTKCGATAITDAASNVLLGKPHNHASSPTKIALKALQHKIKEEAVSSSSTARAVVSNALEGISDGVKVHLPKIKNLQKTVSRKRQRTGTIPPVPHSLTDIIIPDDLRRTKTSEPQDFILSDSGTEDKNRIIIFSCTSDLNRLIQCQTWVVDGTFTSAPNLWYQLWVIYGVFHSKTIPFIYAFLPNKNEDIYERTLVNIFQKIDTIQPGARPNTIIIDFEMAVVNTFRQLVPDVKIRGCFFHFCKAIWLKVQQLGLEQIYTDDEYFQTIIKSFCALSFVPPAEVSHAFELLGNELVESFGEDERYHGFIDYFIATWVGRTLPPRNPRFAINVWNCNNITLEGLPRATNSIESWHHIFYSIFSSHHLNPNRVIEKLLKEQLTQDDLCTRLEAGHVIAPYSHKQYQIVNEKFLQIIKDYNSSYISGFLQICSHYVIL
uniref:Uncharacterized protein LOC114328960 n=1 Tax=Diabrotica virgifera virgifera TaxID=50390 RepID=A0A6P7FDK2_DIAVI